MAAGAGVETLAKAGQLVQAKCEEERCLQKESLTKSCSRRCQRRVAGRLGLLGRLAAQGRILLADAEAEIRRVLREARAVPSPPENAWLLWEQARQRAGQRVESLFYHLKHNRVAGASAS